MLMKNVLELIMKMLEKKILVKDVQIKKYVHLKQRKINKNRKIYKKSLRIN